MPGVVAAAAAAALPCMSLPKAPADYIARYHWLLLPLHWADTGPECTSLGSVVKRLQNTYGVVCQNLPAIPRLLANDRSSV